MASAVSGHPLTYDVQYPAALSRWMWLIKPFLLIPHVVVIILLGIVFYIKLIVAWFTVVFTGKYPQGMFESNVAFLRYGAILNAYPLMTDLYPAFGTTPKPGNPVTFELAYPPDGKINRLFTLLPILRVLVMIPQIIIMYLRSIVAIVLLYIGGLVILFTGNLPQGMFNFLVETQRLQYKIQVNLLFMTDVRP